MTDSIKLELMNSAPSPVGNALQAKSFVNGAWTGASGFYYLWSGNGGSYSNGVYNFKRKKGDGTYTLNIQRDLGGNRSNMIIRHVWINPTANDATAPTFNIPINNSGDFISSPLRGGGGKGDFYIKDNEASSTTGDTHHIWVWAQFDEGSPVVMCDPIISNKED